MGFKRYPALLQMERMFCTTKLDIRDFREHNCYN
jgi:hypothetical protein